MCTLNVFMLLFVISILHGRLLKILYLILISKTQFFVVEQRIGYVSSRITQYLFPLNKIFFRHTYLVHVIILSVLSVRYDESWFSYPSNTCDSVMRSRMFQVNQRKHSEQTFFIKNRHLQNITVLSYLATIFLFLFCFVFYM